MVAPKSRSMHSKFLFKVFIVSLWAVSKVSAAAAADTDPLTVANIQENPANLWLKESLGKACEAANMVEPALRINQPLPALRGLLTRRLNECTPGATTLTWTEVQQFGHSTAEDSVLEHLIPTPRERARFTYGPWPWLPHCGVVGLAPNATGPATLVIAFARSADLDKFQKTKPGENTYTPQEDTLPPEDNLRHWLHQFFKDYTGDRAELGLMQSIAITAMYLQHQVIPAIDSVIGKDSTTLYNVVFTGSDLGGNVALLSAAMLREQLTAKIGDRFKGFNVLPFNPIENAMSPAAMDYLRHKIGADHVWVSVPAAPAAAEAGAGGAGAMAASALASPPPSAEAALATGVTSIAAPGAGAAGATTNPWYWGYTPEWARPWVDAGVAAASAAAERAMEAARTASTTVAETAAAAQQLWLPTTPGGTEAGTGTGTPSTENS